MGLVRSARVAVHHANPPRKRRVGRVHHNVPRQESRVSDGEPAYELAGLVRRRTNHRDYAPRGRDARRLTEECRGGARRARADLSRQPDARGLRHPRGVLLRADRELRRRDLREANRGHACGRPRVRSYDARFPVFAAWAWEFSPVNVSVVLIQPRGEDFLCVGSRSWFFDSLPECVATVESKYPWRVSKHVLPFEEPPGIWAALFAD